MKHYELKKQECDCGKIAIWVYIPGYSRGGNPYHCDECVPRGCGCNNRYVDPNAYEPKLENPDMPEGEENKDWKWLKENVWTYIDDMGRQYPCVEYMYDEEGFEIDED